MESYYKQNKKLLTDILDILEGHFGKNVEFVVHDLSLDYEHTIVDIRNGEVTGRKVGGTGPVAFTGGVAGSRNLVKLLGRRLGREILTSAQSQLAGALGAAAIAAKRAKKTFPARREFL